MKNLNQEPAKEHETCDGCVCFQDCGCMLDDSCPPCFEHSMWSAIDNDPTEEPSKGTELKNQILALLYQHYDSIADVSDVVNLMEQYRAEGLREELEKFMEFMEERYGISPVSLTQKQVIDEYLKQKP
jgi:hypothetical protein